MKVDLPHLIVRLLSRADPQRAPHRRLLRLQQRVAEGVMLNHGDWRFLQDLRTQWDNLLCVHCTGDGRCAVQQHQPCTFLDRFQACPRFEALPSFVARAPLRAIRS
jgi:hypothetical protein